MPAWGTVSEFERDPAGVPLMKVEYRETPDDAALRMKAPDEAGPAWPMTVNLSYAEVPAHRGVLLLATPKRVFRAATYLTPAGESEAAAQLEAAGKARPADFDAAQRALIDDAQRSGTRMLARLAARRRARRKRRKAMRTRVVRKRPT